MSIRLIRAAMVLTVAFAAARASAQPAPGDCTDITVSCPSNAGAQAIRNYGGPILKHPQLQSGSLGQDDGLDGLCR